MTNVVFITEAFDFFHLYANSHLPLVPPNCYLLKKQTNSAWISRSQSPLFLASPCLTPQGQNFLTMQRLASAADVSDKDAAFAHSGRSCPKSVLAHVLGLSLQLLPLLNFPQTSAVKPIDQQYQEERQPHVLPFHGAAWFKMKPTSLKMRDAWLFSRLLLLPPLSPSL